MTGSPASSHPLEDDRASELDTGERGTERRFSGALEEANLGASPQVLADRVQGVPPRRETGLRLGQGTTIARVVAIGLGQDALCPGEHLRACRPDPVVLRPAFRDSVVCDRQVPHAGVSLVQRLTAAARLRSDSPALRSASAARAPASTSGSFRDRSIVFSVARCWRSSAMSGAATICPMLPLTVLSLPACSRV